MTDTKLTHNTEESSFGSILKARAFYHIPPFQRPYRWKKERLNKLISDANLIKDTEKTAHFLGAFIINQIPSSPSDPNTYEVIDGQQRLTTIYLLIAGAVKTLLQKRETDKAGGLAITYLFTTKGINTLVGKLLPSIPDRDAINHVLNDLLRNGLTTILSSYRIDPLSLGTNGRNLIWSNYQHCCKITAAIFNDEGVSGLEAFIAAVQSGLNVIQIIVKDPLSGPKIFDSLNSNQEPMTIGDLVRNEIFSNISQSDPHLAEINNQSLWIPFYRSFKKDNIDYFEDYFFPYGLIQNHRWRKSEVYIELKNIWSSKNYATIIEELKEYSTEFQDLRFGENTSSLPSKVAKKVMNLHRMKFPSSALPFLMKVCHEVRIRTLDEAQGEDLLSIVESFLMRRALCGIEPTGLHAVFKSLWHDISATPTSAGVKAAIRSAVTVTVPTDANVRASFDSPLYKKGIVKYFLFEYDFKYGGDQSDYQTFQIEHILPKTYPSADWGQVSVAEHPQLKDLAGNLVPLTASMNNQVGQSSYDVKKLIFKCDSGFKSARMLATEYPTWDANSIRTRNEAMAEWAVLRWKY